MKLNTQDHIATCIASEKMESSQIDTQVINLGKKLISELRLDYESDITASWMAHYVAEKIHEVEESGGAEAANDICFNAILKLWEHRYSSPESIQPFQRFESVFSGLTQLDESSNLHYFQRFKQLSQENIEELNDESRRWVDIALSADNAARFLVLELFKLAAKSATSDKIRGILDSTYDDKSYDIQVLRHLIGEPEQENDTEKELESKIQKIKNMQMVCDVLLQMFEEQKATD